MAKANIKSRFAIFNPFRPFPFIRGVRLQFLDHEEVLNKTEQIKQVLKEIKERKGIEKHFINFGNPKISQLMKEYSIRQQRNNVAKPRKPQSQKKSEQIQRGFNLAQKWKLNSETVVI